MQAVPKRIGNCSLRFSPKQSLKVDDDSLENETILSLGSIDDPSFRLQSAKPTQGATLGSVVARLFSDDVACDIRDHYRQLLEDGARMAPPRCA